jgi:signal transduction histidine kinase/CheY-like chemotaxis protein
LILEANHTAREMLCASRGTLVQQSLTRYVHREDQDLYYLYGRKNAAATGPHTCELRMLKADGSPIWVQLTTTHIPAADQDAEAAPGSVAVSRLVLSDISGIKHAEEDKTILAIQLHHAKRLETLGILAAGFSQDFNQLLAAILDQATAGSRVADGNPRLTQPFVVIERSALKAMELIQQVLGYAGKLKWNLVEVDLDGIAREVARTLAASLPENLTLRVDLANRLPEWNGDAIQALQVLMHLAVNAYEAFPAGTTGEITLRTWAEQVVQTDGGPGIWILPVVAGAYAVLEVTDNGKGMTPDLLYHAFEPFHTTKATGRGLGLAAVHGILSGHGAGLWVQSGPGQGTSIKVYLPAMPEPQADSAAETLTPWRGHGAILVVDPEPEGRCRARALAERSGFMVLEARGGIEAMELFRSHKQELVLVLLDKGLKGSSVREILGQIHGLDDQMPVLITERRAGHGWDSSPATEAGLLGKPYRPAEFQEALHRALEPRSSLESGILSPRP